MSEGSVWLYEAVFLAFALYLGPYLVHMFMYYTVCYFTGIFYAVVRQISMLFINNKKFCILFIQWSKHAPIELVMIWVWFRHSDACNLPHSIAADIFPHQWTRTLTYFNAFSYQFFTLWLCASFCWKCGNHFCGFPQGILTVMFWLAGFPQGILTVMFWLAGFPQGILTVMFWLAGFPQGILTVMFWLSGFPQGILTVMFWLAGFPQGILTVMFWLAGFPQGILTVMFWLAVAALYSELSHKGDLLLSAVSHR